MQNIKAHKNRWLFIYLFLNRNVHWEIVTWGFFPQKVISEMMRGATGTNIVRDMRSGAVGYWFETDWFVMYV